MSGRPANKRLSHRWCGWCGETVTPPSFIYTEPEWLAWPAQFCSNQCAEDYAADVWRELQQQRASAATFIAPPGASRKRRDLPNLPGRAPARPGLWGRSE
jgi:hypothetical protein